MRTLPILLIGLGLFSAALPARAETSPDGRAGTDAAGHIFFGSPTIQSSGSITLDGLNVTLWGVDALAADQQCWHGDVAWDCGAEALAALRHYTANHLIRCVSKSDFGGGHVSAQCFRQNNAGDDDIARYLVQQGWARDLKDISDGAYAYDETDARQARRGVWTSRFQTSSDWQNGNQRFVPYDEASPEEPVTQTQTINNITILPAGSVEIIHGGADRDPINNVGDHGDHDHGDRGELHSTTTSGSGKGAILSAPAILKGQARQPQINQDPSQ
jgi:hypothetical protein